MRTYALLTVVALTVSPSDHTIRRELPTAVPNPNTAAAGELRDGVLRVALDAHLTMWYPDGDSLPGIAIEAFAEAGKKPQVPGPLIRVPQGTEIRASVRNSLERDTLTFYWPVAHALDSLTIPPGKTAELRVRAAAPGTFAYRATTRTRLSQSLGIGGLLAGAFVVDSAGVAPARDRIFVILAATDTTASARTASNARSVRSINGRSWPATERLSALVGDTLHWRVINASYEVHPMHLHGFYYRVDAFDNPSGTDESGGAPRRMVVTERMERFTTMSMTWVAERPGNWLFHCHFQEHVTPHGPLGAIAPNGERQRIGDRANAPHAPAHSNHALTAMAGLVLGVEVKSRAGPVARAADAGRAPRRLRLVAMQDAGFPDSAPSMRFVLEEPATHGRAETGPGISPTIDLKRGEPVSIMVVNHLHEGTTVHWHGIELESFFDGVGGFSGSRQRLAPSIAPNDSFDARFTPPRAGTFMYHAHMDEPRQHRAGLVGALIVRDAHPPNASEDLVFVIKSARSLSASVPLEINGKANPDTVVMRIGHRYRMRFIGLPVAFPAPHFSLTARRDSAFATPPRDSLVGQWRPVAKDGRDLPEAARVPRLARQTISMGETYDFEYTPERPGNLRLEWRATQPFARLIARVPIRVEGVR